FPLPRSVGMNSKLPVEDCGLRASGREADVISRPAACHSSSTKSRLMNSARGMLLRSFATLSRSIVSGSEIAWASASPASRRLMAWSSASYGEMLFILTPRLMAQTLKRPELQLLDCPFAAAQFLCDFTDAFLIHKSSHHHQALVGRKSI